MNQLVEQLSTNPRVSGSTLGPSNAWPHVEESLDTTLNPKPLAP